MIVMHKEELVTLVDLVFMTTLMGDPQLIDI